MLSLSKTFYLLVLKNKIFCQKDYKYYHYSITFRFFEWQILDVIVLLLCLYYYHTLAEGVTLMPNNCCACAHSGTD